MKTAIKVLLVVVFSILSFLNLVPGVLTVLSIGWTFRHMIKWTLMFIVVSIHLKEISFPLFLTVSLFVCLVFGN